MNRKGLLFLVPGSPNWFLRYPAPFLQPMSPPECIKVPLVLYFINTPLA